MLPLKSTGREISPAVNATAEEYFDSRPSLIQSMIQKIRSDKAAGTRCLPSKTLLDSSSLLTPDQRAALLDSVATLVDENLCGRSDMCQQFADLLQRALAHLNLPARAVVGTAMYFSAKGEELFRWKHAWVRVGNEVIDGNTDSVFENPKFPKEITAAPYWGNIREIPSRRVREDSSASFPGDTDVSAIWWPELRDWLDKEFRV